MSSAAFPKIQGEPAVALALKETPRRYRHRYLLSQYGPASWHATQAKRDSLGVLGTISDVLPGLKGIEDERIFWYMLDSSAVATAVDQRFEHGIGEGMLVEPGAYGDQEPTADALRAARLAEAWRDYLEAKGKWQDFLKLLHKTIFVGWQPYVRRWEQVSLGSLGRQWVPVEYHCLPSHEWYLTEPTEADPEPRLARAWDLYGTESHILDPELERLALGWVVHQETLSPYGMSELVGVLEEWLTLERFNSHSDDDFATSGAMIEVMTNMDITSDSLLTERVQRLVQQWREDKVAITDPSRGEGVSLKVHSDLVKVALEVKTRTADAIRLRLLGQNLTTKVEAGSHAAAQTHQGVMKRKAVSDGMEVGGMLSAEVHMILAVNGWKASSEVLQLPRFMPKGAKIPDLAVAEQLLRIGSSQRLAPDVKALAESHGIAMVEVQAPAAQGGSLGALFGDSSPLPEDVDFSEAERVPPPERSTSPQRRAVGDLGAAVEENGPDAAHVVQDAAAASMLSLVEKEARAYGKAMEEGWIALYPDPEEGAQLDFLEGSER